MHGLQYYWITCFGLFKCQSKSGSLRHLLDKAITFILCASKVFVEPTHGVSLVRRRHCEKKEGACSSIETLEIIFLLRRYKYPPMHMKQIFE